MTETWRLILDAPAGGEWNMAVDSALLHSAEEGKTPPVLRFYAWEKPTLSIGRLQKIGGAVNHEYLAAKDIPLVRRPTGGRALLHDDEVTYSVTLPEGSGLYGSLDKVYADIALALRDALTNLGAPLDPAANQKGGEYALSQACFAVRTGRETSIGGKKVAAAAQRRLKRSAMQHGSILLSARAKQSLDCLLWRDEEERRQAGESMIGLCQAMKRPVSSAGVTSAVIGAFARIHGVKLERSALTPAEKDAAERIMDQVSRSAPGSTS